MEESNPVAPAASAAAGRRQLYEFPIPAAARPGSVRGARARRPPRPAFMMLSCCICGTERVCVTPRSAYTTLALAGPAEPRGVHREARGAAHQHHHTRHTLAPGTLAAQTSALHWHEFRFRSVRTWASRLRAQRCSCSSSTRWGIFSAQMRLCPSCHSSPS